MAEAEIDLNRAHTNIDSVKNTAALISGTTPGAFAISVLSESTLNSSECQTLREIAKQAVVADGQIERADHSPELIAQALSYVEALLPEHSQVGIAIEMLRNERLTPQDISLLGKILDSSRVEVEVPSQPKGPVPNASNQQAARVGGYSLDSQGTQHTYLLEGNVMKPSEEIEEFLNKPHSDNS